MAFGLHSLSLDWLFYRTTDTIVKATLDVPGGIGTIISQLCNISPVKQSGQLQLVLRLEAMTPAMPLELETLSVDVSDPPPVGLFPEGELLLPGAVPVDTPFTLDLWVVLHMRKALRMS